MRIYLDDERNPKVEQFDVVIRSFKNFEVLLHLYDHCTEVIEYVSFDHDLGTEKTGYDCVKLLVEYDIAHKMLAKDFTFNVHSANPVGAKNIQAYMENYLEQRC